jgi:hypothetical protein
MPDSGTMTWGDWRFSWEIGSANDEGLVLRNVKWKNTQVLYKASLPVIRVKYRGREQHINAGCGPYRDRIDHDDIVQLFPGQTTDVVSRQFNSNLFEIAILAKIGGYILYQAYYFHTSGRFEPVLYSSGWSCTDDKHENDHKHHPHWRLDFDIDSPVNQVFHGLTDSTGGMSFALYSPEAGFAIPNGTREIHWTIGNQSNSKWVLIRAPQNERVDPPGRPWFGFSLRDVEVRRWRASEDSGWPFSAISEVQFFSPSPEVTQWQDIVFWAISHLTHTWSTADVNNPEWHSTGWIIDAKW